MLVHLYLHHGATTTCNAMLSSSSVGMTSTWRISSRIPITLPSDIHVLHEWYSLARTSASRWSTSLCDFAELSASQCCQNSRTHGHAAAKQCPSPHSGVRTSGGDITLALAFCVYLISHTLPMLHKPLLFSLITVAASMHRQSHSHLHGRSLGVDGGLLGHRILVLRLVQLDTKALRRTRASDMQQRLAVPAPC